MHTTAMTIPWHQLFHCKVTNFMVEHLVVMMRHAVTLCDLPMHVDLVYGVKTADLKVSWRV
jgi:hypothetical protein